MSSHVAGVVDLIQTGLSSLSFADISPDPIPINATLPYITVSEAMAKDVQSLTGPSGATYSVMRISCWSGDYEEANDLRSLIKDLLGNYTGEAGDYTVMGTNHYQDRELYDGLTQKYQLITSYSIWWTE